MAVVGDGAELNSEDDRGAGSDSSSTNPEEAPGDEPREPPPELPPVAEPTVGTGSYIAVTCTVLMLVVTGIALAVLFILRWIN